MSELYPVLLPFAACLIFFIVWISQQKKSVRKPSAAKSVAPAQKREEVVPAELSAEPVAL